MSTWKDQNEAQGCRLIHRSAEVEFEDPHNHHLLTGGDQEQGKGGFLEGEEEGVQRADQFGFHSPRRPCSGKSVLLHLLRQGFARDR